jgi:hypothetical protein
MAANGCFLGVGLTEAADRVALSQGYGEFQQEARFLDSNVEDLFKIPDHKIR